MNDLIRRKDAIDALGEEPLVWDEWTDEYNKGMRTLWAVAKRDIESLPSIDAVPVVKCNDCKYAYITNDGECKYCDIWFPVEAKYLDGDYYCASAERKES